MRARTQIVCIRWVARLVPLAALVTLLFVLLDDLIHSPGLLLLVGVAYGLATYAAATLAARLRRSLCARLDGRLRSSRHDVVRLRESFDDFSDGYVALGLAPDVHLRLWEADVLLEEERFADARLVLLAINASGLRAPEDELRHDQALVWALVHEGRLEAAAAIAARAVLDGSAPAADMHAAIGAHLVMQKQYAAALAHLEVARAAAARPLASRYYLGVALWGTGQHDAAEHAWEELRVLAPDSCWAGRLDQLTLADAAPYR
ncbi:MAG: hypothetical protein ABI321_11615 [Polyangia bacterium]